MSYKLLAIALLAVGCRQHSTLPTNPPSDSANGIKAIAEELQRGKQERGLVVSATGERTSRGPILRFMITNVSGDSLRFYKYQLPWGNPNSLEIAVTTVSGHQLPVVWPIADPAPPGPDEPIVLAPGASLSGEYEVGWRISRLDGAARKELIIPWVYTLPVSGEAERTIVSGVAYVPREAGP